MALLQTRLDGPEPKLEATMIADLLPVQVISCLPRLGRHLPGYQLEICSRVHINGTQGRKICFEA